MTHFTESAIEQAALDWLKGLGYTILFGGDIAPVKDPKGFYGKP
jgi:hypothetical protein